jgi:predicted RNase H-like HicB family nuclease
MKLKVIIHQAEEGGYWAEVPAIPGCFTQGDTWDELIQNLYEAIEGCLEVNMKEFEFKPDDKVIELAV